MVTDETCLIVWIVDILSCTHSSSVSSLGAQLFIVSPQDTFLSFDEFMLYAPKAASAEVDFDKVLLMVFQYWLRLNSSSWSRYEKCSGNTDD